MTDQNQKKEQIPEAAAVLMAAETPQDDRDKPLAERAARPWTIRQLILATPLLEKVANAAKARGVGLEEITGAFSNPEAAWSSGLDVLLSSLPEVPELIAISLKVPVEEVDELGALEAAMLAMKVIGVNMEYLTSFFDRLAAEAKTIMAKTPKGPKAS